MTLEEYIKALENGENIDYLKLMPENKIPIYGNTIKHKVKIGIVTERSEFISNYTYEIGDRDYSIMSGNGFYILGIINDVLYYAGKDKPLSLHPGDYVTGGNSYSSYDNDDCISYLEFI